MLFVLLPAYNEERALPILLAELETTCAKLAHRIVVVDDGSTDGTLRVLKGFASQCKNVEIVEHRHNLGLSQALKSGFQRILAFRAGDFGEQMVDDKAFSDVVITMDADNTHPTDRIPLLCAQIEAGADLVVASRYASGGEQFGLKFGRKLLSWGAGKVMRFFFPLDGVQDYSCGYRAYRINLLQKGFRVYGEKLIENCSFAGMVELLLKLAPLCSKISEVPLQLHYERKEGVSKMKIWTTIWGYGQVIYRLKRQSGGSIKWAEE
ncbi:MAG: glycosyltransferase [Desulfitobacteriaceae bacterium]